MEQEQGTVDQVEEWMTRASVNLIKLMVAEGKIDALSTALRKIEKAIIEEGKMPDYHKSVMKRHREEWGTLWNAIDDAMKVLNGEQK